METDARGTAAGVAAAASAGRTASPLRWLLLALAVAILVGPYYAFDNPAGAQNAMREAAGSPVTININSSAAQNASYADFNTRYNLLYSLYSIPNTVLPLVGGLAVDRVGVRSMVVGTTGLALVGQALVIGGVGDFDWPLMWAGRAVFGVGTESMCVAQRILVTRWFMGSELALANGVILAFGRLGSVINDVISAEYPASRVQQAFCIGATWCLASLLAALAAAALDRRQDRVAATAAAAAASKPGYLAPSSSSTINSSSSKVADWPLLAGAGGVDDDDGGVGDDDAVFIPRPPPTPGAVAGTAAFEAAPPLRSRLRGRRRRGGAGWYVWCWQAARTQVAALCAFPLGYWLLAVLVIVGFPPITTFNGIASALLAQRAEASGGDSSAQAVEHVLSIMYSVAAGIAPFGGALVDRVRYRFAFMAAAQGLMIVAHVLFAITDTPAAALVAILGVAFGLFAAAFWTTIALVVPPATLGLAYGFMGALQNSGLAVAPIVAAALEPPACDGEFSCVAWLFAGLAAVGTGVAIAGHIWEVAVLHPARAAAPPAVVSDDVGSPTEPLLYLEPDTDVDDYTAAGGDYHAGNGGDGSGYGGDPSPPPLLVRPAATLARPAPTLPRLTV